MVDYTEALGLLDDEIRAKVEFDAIEQEATSLLDTALDPIEARILAETSVDFLAAIAMPTVFEFFFPPVLIAVWQLLQQSLAELYKFPQIALGIPRGHAKTTLMKLFVLYCVLFTKLKFILIIGPTDQHATNFIADVESMLKESNIIKLFGDFKYASEIDRQDLKKFTFRGRSIVIAGIGQGSSLRGLNLNNERPDLMIFDDVQTKECAESSLQSDSLLRWMIGTAMKAKSPRGCLFVFVGNMYPGSNSILKKLRDNATWIKFVSGAILADGRSLWPELRSLESLIAEFNNDIALGHPEIFLSEVMNDTEVGINNNTDLEKIATWPWGPHEPPQGKFIIVDPSAGKKKSDDVTIGYFEIYDEVPALRKLVIDKLSPGNTIRQTLLLALQNNVTLIAAEATAYQATLLYWFEEVCKSLHVGGLQFVEIHSGSISKNVRIADALKSLQAKEIVLHPDVLHQVIHQITNWNPLKRDNTDGILDLLAYAHKVMNAYPYEIAVNLESMLEPGTDLTRVLEDNHAF